MLWRREALARALAQTGERGDAEALMRAAAALPGARIRHVAEILDFKIA
jgi:hypothetical protein